MQVDPDILSIHRGLPSSKEELVCVKPRVSTGSVPHRERRPRSFIASAHLLDDAAALADAGVRACPQVTVLATSREALDVAGERVLRVRSLDAPAVSARGDELVQSAAVRLFADRCADAGTDRFWDERQWAAVGEVCRRVDGIPLAIE